MAFEAINEVKEQENKNSIKSAKILVVNVLVINQAKEQGANAYQCTETCRFGFDAIYEVKEQVNEVFIKSQKILVSSFMP